MTQGRQPWPVSLLAGIRLSNHISRVIDWAIPPAPVQQAPAETSKSSERERDLPSPAMVYYAIALAFSSTREVLRCLLKGLRWLWGADAVRVACTSGIFQLRSRLREARLRRLYEALVGHCHPGHQGGVYRGWRLVSLDGSCPDWLTRRRTAPS